MPARVEFAMLQFVRVLFHNSGSGFCIIWPLKAFLSLVHSVCLTPGSHKSHDSQSGCFILSSETVIKMAQAMKQKKKKNLVENRKFWFG